MQYGLIGKKLGHSFSKIIHNELYSEEYSLKEIAKSDFDSFMKIKDFKAINVTIPYKQDVMPYLDFVDENAKKTRENLEKCIWKTDEFGTPDKSKLKIDSEVATDNDKDEFLNILKTGKVTSEMKSKYANNYRFFENKIADFLNSFAGYFSYLPIRILSNCILWPIEAESQDTALRIFSTLNDRGRPLSDADIFKAQFYKFYTKKGQKAAFIKRWKELEELSNKIFHPITGTPQTKLQARQVLAEYSILRILQVV